MNHATVQREAGSCCSVLHTPSMENYLKALFESTVDDTGTTTTALALRLRVEPPSVSAMLRRLSADDLIARPGSHLIELTPHGKRHAVAVVRRHRLIEEFLFRVLDVPWDELHSEAEVLEHAVSDRLLQRIDVLLGHPTRDPHGDPIPSGDGDHVETWSTSLRDARIGGAFRVERVRDRDQAALRHLGELGIRPGVVLRVIEQVPFGGPLWVEVDGGRQPLGAVLVDIVFGADV